MDIFLKKGPVKIVTNEMTVPKEVDAQFFSQNQVMDTIIEKSEKKSPSKWFTSPSKDDT